MAQLEHARDNNPMFAPNEGQANMTIRSAMQRVVELNEGQPYSIDRDGLVAMLDEMLEAE
jgi:hypothetical protein